MLIKGCHSQEELDELKAQVYRPPLRALDGTVSDDDDLPDWATDFTPAWWGGHEAAAFDAERGGQLKAER